MAKAKEQAAVREVPLDQLVMDAGTQTRAGINEAAVEDYAADLSRGDEFPPVEVIETPDGRLILAAGFHRVCAHGAAGLAAVKAIVKPGTLEDALLAAARSNKGHGLRRRNEDKRSDVRTVLGVRPDWSNRRVADHCGVDDKTAASVRAEICSTAELPQLNTTEGADGKARPATAAPAAEREARDAEIAEGRARGKTVREIADEVGVSVGTVAAAERRAGGKPKSAERQEQVKDRVGRVVPARLRDAFADGALPELVARLESWAKLVVPDAAKAVEKRAAAYPFIDAAQVREGLDEARACLEAAASYVRDNLPYTVCPECSGTGSIEGEGRCEACRLGCGYVPEWRLKELRTERRAS